VNASGGCEGSSSSALPWLRAWLAASIWLHANESLNGSNNKAVESIACQVAWVLILAYAQTCGQQDTKVDHFPSGMRAALLRQEHLTEHLTLLRTTQTVSDNFLTTC
jgi:hypothetical protein